MSVKEPTDPFRSDRLEAIQSRSRLIAWENLSRYQVTLDSQGLQTISSLGNDDKLEIIMQSEPAKIFLSQTLLKLANNCHSDVFIQQFSFLVMELILGVDSSHQSKVFGPQNAQYLTYNGQLSEGPFIRALNNSDPTVQRSASNVFACLLSRFPGDFTPLVNWINQKLQSTNRGWEVALQTISFLSRRPDALHFMVTSGTAQSLLDLVRTTGVNGNAQQLYDLCFSLWTLTMGVSSPSRGQGLPEEVSRDIETFLHAGVIPELVPLLAAAPSRKVVRMVVGIFANLAQTQSPDLLTEMLAHKVERLLENVSATNSAARSSTPTTPTSPTSEGGPSLSSSLPLSSDPEFEDDLSFLQRTLTENYRDLSSFDRWASEVHSGALRWGIVHTERFWKENAKLAEKGEFQHIKELINILQQQRSEEEVCVALFDLGEFSRYYPNGRQVVSVLKGKDLCLSLLSSPLPSVQAQALQAASKILVQHWDLVR